MNDTKLLRIYGNNYFKESFKIVKNQKQRYRKDFLYLGISKLTKNPVGIECEDAKRVIMLGAPGSGKTFALRGFMDRAVQSGSAVVFLTDVKRELVSSIKPVQTQFQHMLLEHEKPKSMKVVSLRPTFFKQLLPSDWSNEEKNEQGLKKGDFWYSPDLSKMTRADFATFIRAKEMKQLQQAVVDLWYDEIENYMKHNDNFNFEIMFNLLDKIEDANPTTIQSLKLKLRPLLKSCFYEPEHMVDIIDLINRGFIPSLNLEDFDSFSRDSGFCYSEIAVTLLLRELIAARRKGLIKKLWIVIDECARFFGKDNVNSLLTFLLESIELDRRYHVSYLFATQSITTMPDRMILASSYICLPARISPEEVKVALSHYGMTLYHQNLNRDANRIVQNMSFQTRDWTLLSKDEKKKIVFNTLAPLSWHMESNDVGMFE